MKLLKGEAEFEVQHDTDWPFDVDSGEATVRALGTKFHVRRGVPGAAVVTAVSVSEGRVLVTSNVGGLPEIVEDGVTGFACPPDAVEMMADRSVALLTSPDLRRRVTRTAVEMVRTRYCTSAIVPLYEAHYEEVLAARA